MNLSSALKKIHRLEPTTYYGPREITAFLSMTPVLMGSIKAMSNSVVYRTSTLRAFYHQSQLVLLPTPTYTFVAGKLYTVELHWLDHLWVHKTSSRQGWCEPMRADKSARSGGFIGLFFIFFIMKVCCLFSLELPH